jgi:N-acetylglucosaminyl-diphospho-decaprenol L-rhamnosyltransferase
VTVGAIIVHFEFWPGLRETVDALLAQSRPPEAIVIVENASRESRLEEIRAAYPMVDVVESRENRGYAGGVNLGLSRLDGTVDSYLFLSHECVLEPLALERLVARLGEDPTLGVVGPLLGYRSEPDIVFSAGARLDPKSWNSRHIRTPKAVSDWRARPPHRVDWLDGAALLIRDEARRAAGLFPEEYFQYYEEVEYLLRIRAAGWGIECVPAAVARQQPGSFPTYLAVRNRLRFVARTGPRACLVRELVRQAWFLARDAAGWRRRPTAVSARLRGMRDFLLGRSGAGYTRELLEGAWRPASRTGFGPGEG